MTDILKANNGDLQPDIAGLESLMKELDNNVPSDRHERELLSRVFSCIDNTSLNSTDSDESIDAFCRHTLSMLPLSVASICVFPLHVAAAVAAVEGSGIKVAAVAGGFPAGQIPARLKDDEVRYVIDHGADEVDFVIDRGAFLQGDRQKVFDEVASAKAICGTKTLKVIIESGELSTWQNIYDASTIALQAGADFIKTSTGKIPVGATVESVYVMLTALRDFCKKNKKCAGFKAAGGISSTEDALRYYRMAQFVLDNENINNQIFRIGTSRLTNVIYDVLTK